MASRACRSRLPLSEGRDSPLLALMFVFVCALVRADYDCRWALTQGGWEEEEEERRREVVVDEEDEEGGRGGGGVGGGGEEEEEEQEK